MGNIIQKNRVILVNSLILGALVIVTSCVGLFTPNFYSVETLNWQAQSVGQDMIDLFLIVPCLIITSFLAYKNNRKAIMVWGGIMLYITYTFTLYCFDVHFNKLFVLYCMCLGLSFYSFLYFLFIQYKEYGEVQFESKLIRFISIYFFFISVVFSILWLSEILPSIIQNTIPKSVIETGLFTNGVHVIDLSVLLPGIFITGIFLLKRISLGFILTPVILTFFILMDITIGALVIVMGMKGIESNLILTVIMSVFTVLSLVILVIFLRSIKPIPSSDNLKSIL